MKKELEVLQMIVDDMEADVKRWDGAPFDGRTLAAIHGELCATIQAIAKILKKHLEGDTTPKIIIAKNEGKRNEETRSITEQELTNQKNSLDNEGEN